MSAIQTPSQKDVLTTGEVARLCHVAPRTVSKWVDTGELRGYRIPGSRDRRIPRRQLLAFMRAHGMPLDSLDAPACRVLVVDRDAPPVLAAWMNQTGRFEAHLASNGFEAGVLAEQLRPAAIVLDADDLADATITCRNIKAAPNLSQTRVLAAVTGLTPDARRVLANAGFDGCVDKPYLPQLLIRAVRNAIHEAQ